MLHRCFSRRFFVTLVAAFIWVLPAHAGTDSPAKAVEHLLSAASPPKGVVFDIVSRDPKYLDTALEQVKVWERQLQARYPTIDIAVVSHGDEQLALTTDKQAIEFTANSLVEELLGDNVALHVCAAHAATKGVAPDEYPAHIDVTPSGPAKIADYVDRGYVLIVL